MLYRLTCTAVLAQILYGYNAILVEEMVDDGTDWMSASPVAQQQRHKQIAQVGGAVRG